MLEIAHHLWNSSSPLRASSEKIGILTGGGIAPGLNAVISGATQILQQDGHSVVGIPNGWEGMLEPKTNVTDLSGMSRRILQDLLAQGGTILGSSRKKIASENYATVRQVAAHYGLTGLIAVGGDDTLGQANAVFEAGILPVNGVPKTIDNDVCGTEKTFGFDTAVNEAMTQIERMRTEAKSMRRVSIVEIMGRDAGWIALHAGFAAGADITLIPEFPIPDERLMTVIRDCYERQGHVVIALAEAYHATNGDEVDEFNHAKKKDSAQTLAKLVKDRLALETQEQIVGYATRYGSPNAQDRIFATQMGALAGFLSACGTFGFMTALRSGRITHVPLSEARPGRRVTEEFYDQQTLSMRLLPPSLQSS